MTIVPLENPVNGTFSKKLSLSISLRQGPSPLRCFVGLTALAWQHWYRRLTRLMLRAITRKRPHWSLNFFYCNSVKPPPGARVSDFGFTNPELGSATVSGLHSFAYLGSLLTQYFPFG
jgi:hypothetical protein